MSIETAAATAQAITWLDVFRLAIPVIPSIIAGLVAIKAVKLTYEYADKGRKQDILYKERYKSYEVLGEYLFNIQSTVKKYNLHGFEPTSDNILIETGIIIDSMGKFISGEPNNRYLVLFRNESKDLFYDVISALKATKAEADEILHVINTSRGIYHPDPLNQPKGHRALWARLDSSVNALKSSVEKCHESLVIDLGLPSK